jgi:FtsP/CotA-like multicopper oxidase with cupredoxin domain
MKLMATAPTVGADVHGDEPGMAHAMDHGTGHDAADHEASAAVHGSGHDFSHVPAHHGSATADGIEWEDEMAETNRTTTTETMRWKLLDRTAGRDGLPVDWRFTAGQRVKIRLVNEMDSDHPMHHPFHIHGAGRFLVLTRDGMPEPNLVWKDTVLIPTGQTVDILLDVTNPDLWMAHCHIAEHMHAGMMFSFTVDRAATS